MHFIKNMFKPITVIVLQFILLLTSYEDVMASHAMGADLTYHCLGSGPSPGSFQYELTFSFYRDCSGIPAPFILDIQITNSCGYTVNDIILNPTIFSPTQISPLCPTEVSTCNGGSFTGIEEWIYTGIVTLPGACTDWTFSHSENVRNIAITTLQFSPPFGSSILYVYSTLNNTNGICDDSPTFGNKPVPFACTGQRFCFNHGAYDAQGDSLSYQLITPRIGPNLSDTVIYLPGYSTFQPVLSNPPMSFNTATGDFCMNPSQVDVTVLAVLVNEYRNGVLIGQVERDIQLTVLPCSNSLPVLTGVNGTPFFKDSVCTGSQRCFYIRSIDPDASNNTTITWDNSIPGATFTTFGGHRDSAIFCWTPVSSDISSTPYCFTVTVSDDNCPYIGVQVYSYCIKVNGVDADAGPDQTVLCGFTTNLSGSATGGNGNYNYTWNPGGVNFQQLSNVGAGIYYLTVSSSGCSNVDTVQITPGIGVPVSNFSFTNNCSGDPIQFSDISNVTGSTLSAWSWDFGDGNMDSSQSPAHQFINNGTYNVTLTVSTPSNCTASITQQITINTNIPTVQFSSPNVCDGITMTFTDQSTGAPFSNWSWDFNDPVSSSDTSNLQNPSHTFSAPGTFLVSLTVTNADGCHNQIQQNVTVNPIPVASIINPNPACGSNLILFSDASAVQSGFITNWSWNFGNGQTSMSQNPVVNYSSAGNFNINLQVTSDRGCMDTAYSIQTIWAHPVASFTNTGECEGNPISFVNASFISDGSPLNYNWNLGDSFTTSGTSFIHQYATYGTYLASLVVLSINGCVDSISKLVNVYSNPQAALKLDYSCEDQPSEFLDISTILQGIVNSWYWTFGDNNSSSDKNPKHTFSDPGSYNIHMLVTSDHGCQDSIDGLIRVVPKPIVDFTAQNVCLGYTANLTNFSQSVTSPIIRYKWNFGDGETSIDQNPHHKYSSSGWFEVSLTATTDSNCSTTLVRPNAINIYPLPNVYFTSNSTNANDIYPLVNFVNETSSSGFYYWNFGDGDTSTKYSPTHLYPDIGNYDVRLIAADLNGCIDSTLIHIEIKPTSNIYIPDAFTPNGDTRNDYFQVFSYNVKNIEVQIYDRWGIKIVEWNDLKGRWDGSMNGIPAQEDTYIYRISTVDVNDKREVRIGHVSLVR